MPDGLLTVVTSDAAWPGRTATAGPATPGCTWARTARSPRSRGKVEGGQGTRTALAMLVAEELTVPVGSVTVAMGDTGDVAL